jgi:2-oxoglutarate/2-oxoacid ferredoxin oxidoreductase subunit alpha
MKFDVSVRIAGEAGQGIQTVGLLLCRLVNETGLEIFAHQDYMSRVRGGNNFYQVRIGSERPPACRETIDLLAALSRESVFLHRPNLSKYGKLLADSARFGLPENQPDIVNVPFVDLAERLGGHKKFAGSVAFGAVAGMLSFEWDAVNSIIRREFGSRGDGVEKSNSACARAGYDLGRFNASSAVPRIGATGSPRHLIDGNEAIALGAVYAGCRFYSGYPMTPSTTVMETLAGLSADVPLVVEQAEDELAAVNMAVGASYAGVRSMTATSGGGFCLMEEGLSLAAMVETPVVIMLGQRPGPATGLPTRTEQADLNLAIYSGHGEFARVVYAPGTIEEAFELTVKAFDVSDRLQVPAIILSDQYLADTVRTVNGFSGTGLHRESHALSGEKPLHISRYRRYELTSSGISPRAVPSRIEDVVYADSDEHDETGHITEDADVRAKMVEKRFYRKLAALRAEALAPAAVNEHRARFLLIGFGSTKGAVEELCGLPEFNDCGGVHFRQVWPFPRDEFRAIRARAPEASLITVENNAGGQLAELIRRETSEHVGGSILKFDGRPFTVEELSRRMAKARIEYGKK